MPNYQDLAHACQKHDLTAFESALQHIPDINAQDAEGRTALGHVLSPDILSSDIYTQHTQIDVYRAFIAKKNSFLVSAVSTLLSKGALCSGQPNLLFPLALAELRPNTQQPLLATLLQAGADINAIGQGEQDQLPIDINGKTVIMAVLDLFLLRKPFTSDLEALLGFLITQDGIALPENLLQNCIEKKIPIQCLRDLSPKSALLPQENLNRAVSCLIHDAQQTKPRDLTSVFTDHSYFVRTLQTLCKLGAQLPEEQKPWLFHKAYLYRIYNLIALLHLYSDIPTLVNSRDSDNTHTAIDHVLFRRTYSPNHDNLGPSGCKLLTELLDYGANLDSISDRGKRHILQQVIKCSEQWPKEAFALLETILSKGILDINIEDDQGVTPFAAAAQQHWPHVEIVGALLAEPSFKLDPQSCTYWMHHLIGQHWRSVSAVETYGTIPPLAADDPKILAISQRLIALGAQINGSTAQGVTLLHKSCTENPALFDYLLQQKNIHIPQDLLHHIISCDNRKLSPRRKIESIVRVLAKNPLSICQVHDGEMPLGVAINQLQRSSQFDGVQPNSTHGTNFEVVNTLLFADTTVRDVSPEKDKIASKLALLIPLTVQHINQHGETMLHQVVRKKVDAEQERKLIATLIEKGADPIILNSDQRTPFYYWCVQDNAQGKRYQSSLERYDAASCANGINTLNLLKPWQILERRQTPPLYLSLVWRKMTWLRDAQNIGKNMVLPALATVSVDHILSYLSIQDFLAVMRGTQLAVKDRFTKRAVQANQLVPNATPSQQVDQTNARSDTEATIGMAPR